MKRRDCVGWLLAGLCGSPSWAQSPPTVGVLMLHGKSPGSPQSPHYRSLMAAMESRGWRVSLPDMPWSRGRYLEGDWDQAMREVAQHVETLQKQGAQKIVLMGHSMGVPAAMSHAARGGVAHALVLLAPGHVPRSYHTVPGMKVVRDSIDEARALVAAGKGDETHRFHDINQGKQQPVITTAQRFLSYYDPESDADMGNTAARIPDAIPVLTVVGQQDWMLTRVRGYYVDKLPTHPRTQLLEVEGGHLDTPRVAEKAIIDWVQTALN